MLDGNLASGLRSPKSIVVHDRKNNWDETDGMLQTRIAGTRVSSAAKFAQPFMLIRSQHSSPSGINQCEFTIVEQSNFSVSMAIPNSVVDLASSIVVNYKYPN